MSVDSCLWGAAVLCAAIVEGHGVEVGRKFAAKLSGSVVCDGDGLVFGCRGALGAGSVCGGIEIGVGNAELDVGAVFRGLLGERQCGLCDGVSRGDGMGSVRDVVACENGEGVEGAGVGGAAFPGSRGGDRVGAGGVSAECGEERRRVDGGALGSSGIKYGPGGGRSYGRGPNYERNSRWRQSKRRVSGSGSGSARGENPSLQVSLEAKWQAENELARLKAERQLELLRAQDLDKVKRMQAAQVMRTTEKCKVDTEKAFSYLAKTGNVPGVVPRGGSGSAKTVVSGATPALSAGRSQGDSISPDSSASMHEFRKLQKDYLDSQAENVRLKKMIADPDVELVGKALTSYTLDSKGRLPANAPSCMEGHDCTDGRFRLEGSPCGCVGEGDGVYGSYVY